MATITITRTFGLEPETPDSRIRPATFDRMVPVTNILIRAGTRLDSTMFTGDGLVAVKQFYMAARVVPGVTATLTGTGLRERAWRCAAQLAYFALQGWWRRVAMLPAVAGALRGVTLPALRGRGFVNEKLIDAVYSGLEGVPVPAGFRSATHVESMARHGRNVLRDMLVTRGKVEINKFIGTIPAGDVTMVAGIAAAVRDDLEGVAGQVTRSLSARLSRRVKDRAAERRLARGVDHLDGLVDEILDGHDLSSWQSLRRQWRDRTMDAIPAIVASIDVDRVIREELVIMTGTMDAHRAVNLVFNPARVHCIVRGTSPADIEAVVRAIVRTAASNWIGTGLCRAMAGVADGLLAMLESNPARWLPVPCCKRPAVPVAIDDGQVYALDITWAHDDEGGAKIDSCPGTGTVVSATTTLSLEPRASCRYRVREAGRIGEMVSRGFTPARGVLTRKLGGGILLHLPFQKDVEVRDDACRTVVHEIATTTTTAIATMPSPVIVAGVDLGLKTLAWKSVGRCIAGPGGQWKRVDANQPDHVRCSIDQPQLRGKRDERSRDDLGPPPRPKGKLVRLHHLAGHLAAKLARVRHAHPHTFRHRTDHAILRREWKRCWAKINAIHRELARQVATRIVASCIQSGVSVLRFEDLSWSSHAPRRSAGGWLAEWQVHWFHGRIVSQATLQARLAGMQVELVDARGTSRRCSRCGHHGIRQGKSFTCTNPACGIRLDADLNAARNIQVAPLSPRLHANGEGARYPPLASATRAST